MHPRGTILTRTAYIYRVSFLMVNDFVCLAYSLCGAKFAEIFRIYAGQIGILCDVLENPFAFLFAGQKLKNIEKS